MRKVQLKLNRMRKYQILVNKGKENNNEGVQLLYKLENITGVEAIQALEEKLDTMRTKFNNDRSLRWRNWVENAWGHKEKDIYKWIRGKKGNGPLIVSKGGSAQMKDILKLAEETWGGLWV
eukprot:16226886-Heterocapsa_arctica.AAC.1